MKKITQVAETGGAPIYFDDFRDVFNDEIWDAIEALLAVYSSDTEGVIVSGCTVGGSGPSSYTISAGIVFLDGEFMRLAAQTGLSLPQYIKADIAVNTQRTFEDTVLKTLYITKSATVAGSAPGAGQYIAITSTTDPDNRRLRKPVTVDPNSVAQLTTKVLNIGTWNMDATPSVTVAHGIADYTKIRTVFVMIRTDDDAIVQGTFPINYNPGVLEAGTVSIDGTNINLSRAGTGEFDATSYDKTSGSFNRGWVTIQYEP